MKKLPIGLVGFAVALTCCIHLSASPTLFLDEFIEEEAISITRDVPYGPAAVNLLDIYEPASPKLPFKRPALIYIHGGGFRLGSKDQQPAGDYNHAFAKRGYVTFNITYTQDGTPDSATQDAVTAILWVKQHAARYNVDPNRIIVGGHSAGAITSINIGVTEAIEAGADVAGLFCAAGAVWASNAENLNKIDENDPPIFLINGTADNLSPVEMARSIAARLDGLNHTESGHAYPYSYVEVIDAGHAFYPGEGAGPLPGFIAGPIDADQGWENTEIEGKTVAAHCFEFFFEHLRLSRILVSSPQSLARSSRVAADGTFEMSIQWDERLNYDLSFSNDLSVWSSWEQEYTQEGGMLHAHLQNLHAPLFCRWELDLDYAEIKGNVSQ